MAHLSKSDFKVAHTCATKLWYKKHGYPTTNDQNEYMKMLADGGFMFGKLAMLLFPEGIEVTGSVFEAIDRTEELLANHKNIILFELREMTNLSTKEIRTSIKKFKKIYFDLVQELLRD